MGFFDQQRYRAKDLEIQGEKLTKSMVETVNGQGHEDPGKRLQCHH